MLMQETPAKEIDRTTLDVASDAGLDDTGERCLERAVATIASEGVP
jgi:hypothetical protein